MTTLKKIRIERGLSLRAAGKLSGVSYVHLCRLENGKGNPKMTTMKKLAEVYNTTITDLIE